MCRVFVGALAKVDRTSKVCMDARPQGTLQMHKERSVSSDEGLCAD